MKKMLYILTHIARLVVRERLWALSFILLALALVAFLVYQVTPVAVVTFIYAGI
jgi:hypothetical protein